MLDFDINKSIPKLYFTILLANSVTALVARITIFERKFYIMKIVNKLLIITVAAFAISCNNSNNAGQTTPEGTTVTNTVNSDMETTRKSADVDTITSPGSNSTDIIKEQKQQQSTEVK